MEKIIECMYEIIECYLGICDKEKMVRDENGYPVLGIRINYSEDENMYTPANQFYAMKEVFLKAAACKSKQLLESEKKLLQNSNIDEIKRIDKSTIIQYIKDHNKKSKHNLELIVSLIYDRLMHVDDRIKSYSNIYMIESESTEELDDVEIKEITGGKKGLHIIANHLETTEDDDVICNETILCYGSANTVADIIFKQRMIEYYINYIVTSASEIDLVLYTSLIDELYHLIITYFNENASFEILSVFDKFNFRDMISTEIEELRASEVISSLELNSIYEKSCDRINEQLLYLKSIDFINISNESDKLKSLLKSLSIIYSSLDFLPAEILKKLLVAISQVYNEKEISGYINSMIYSLIRKKSSYDD